MTISPRIMRGLCATTLLVAALSLPTTLFAQLNLPTVPGDFSLSLSPEVPGAGQAVSAQVASYAENLARATLVWSLNGKIIDSGVGVVTAHFTVGGIGSINVLRVNATLPNGSTLTKTAIVRPAGLDLLWQANVYTPPFYRGKALAPYDATMVLFAMPFFVDENGARIRPEALFYTWHLNGQVLGDSSGRGAQSVTIPGARVYRGINVSVDVASSDGSIKATRSLSFNGDEPFVILYENDPLLGFRFDRALPESVNLTKSEATVSAFPYFFSTDSRGGGALTYAWTLNDKSVTPSSKNPADVVLRQTAPSSGTANLALSLQNVSQIFQATSIALQINFGK